MNQATPTNAGIGRALRCECHADILSLYPPLPFGTRQTWSRMDALKSALVSGDPVTRETFSRTHGVSPRAITRDIAELKRRGLKVFFDREVNSFRLKNP